MRIVVNHLTRMEVGYICAAGLEPETCQPVRPVIANQRLTVDMLRTRGGVFELGAIIDLGPTRWVGQTPEIEDHEFLPARARHCGRLSGAEFWEMIKARAGTSLVEMFGELEPDGRGFSLGVGRGRASLGCLLPGGRPELYVNRYGKTRLRVSDGNLVPELSVTDIRLVEEDHQTPRHEAVKRVQGPIESGCEVIVGVGLTRPFRKREESEARHWLQANNVFVRADPLWVPGADGCPGVPRS